MRWPTHFSGALLAPTLRLVEPRSPLSLLPGGQSSWFGDVLGGVSSDGRSLGLRPRFLPPAGLPCSLLDGSASWLRALEDGGSTEVRNQFCRQEGSSGTPG